MRKLRPQAPSPDQWVVLIDDQRDHLAFMTTLLRRHGYTCVGFASARDALGYIDGHRVDLVIADVFMPDMDGFELLRILQRRSVPIPVLTLSGGDRRGRGDFFLKCTRLLGAVASLKKPFETEALLSVLDCWVPLDRSAAPAARKAALSETTSQCSQQDSETRNVEDR